MTRKPTPLRIRELAQARGWCAAELARRAGVKPETVRRLFRDPARRPSNKTLYLIARAFDLPTIADLFDLR
jgi:transcriptional regulator with XRE-family HTH domain